MNPMLLIGGAAALLLMSGGKKSSKKSSGGAKEPPSMGGVSPGGGRPGGNGPMDRYQMAVGQVPPNKKPWGQCPPPPGSPKGTYATYNQQGECVIFWRPDTWDVVIAEFELALNALPDDEAEAMCDKDHCEPDQYAADPKLSCVWTVSPKRQAFVNSVIMKMYDEIEPHMLPPKDGDPYFVRMVYSLVSGTFAEAFCGYNLTT